MWGQNRGWGRQTQGRSTWDCAWTSYRAFSEVTSSRGSKQEESKAPSPHIMGVRLLYFPSHSAWCALSLRSFLHCFHLPAFPWTWHRRASAGLCLRPCRVEQSSRPAFRSWKDYLLHLGRTPQAKFSELRCWNAEGGRGLWGYLGSKGNNLDLLRQTPVLQG